MKIRIIKVNHASLLDGDRYIMQEWMLGDWLYSTCASTKWGIFRALKKLKKKLAAERAGTAITVIHEEIL